MTRFEQACIAIIGDVADARHEWRENGLEGRQMREATERLVRDKLEKFSPDERLWPEQMRYPRCAYCDGCGLVLQFDVTSRLETTIDVGKPCKCPRGQRFTDAPKPSEDFTAAGKAPKKAFSRFGGGR